MTEAFDPEELAEELAGNTQGERQKSGKQIHFPLSRFHEFGKGMRQRYVVKGLIPHSGLVVVWGPPKCGKSFWTMDCAMHVALDRDYRGHRVSPGIVVYLALEGAAGFKARRDAFAARFLDSDNDPPFYLATTQIDLRKQAGKLVEDIKAQLGGDTPTLVVVDTLNRSLVGSESKDEDMADYIRAADRIRAAFDCAVVIVHHCGINGERPRGHTSLTGAVDAQLAVRKDDDSAIVTVTVEHMKDGDFGEVISSRLEVVELGQDEDGDPITSLVVIPADGSTTNAAGKKAKITGGAVIALEALREAVLDVGRVPPVDSHIPDNTKVVTFDQWRKCAYQRGISGSDDADARKKAFQRAASVLTEKKRVGRWDYWAWLA